MVQQVQPKAETQYSIKLRFHSRTFSPGATVATFAASNLFSSAGFQFKSQDLLYFQKVPAHRLFSLFKSVRALIVEL